MNIVAKNIQNARKDKSITQEELAKNTNISLENIMKYESGKVIPSIDKLKLIAECLDSDLDKFIELPDPDEEYIGENLKRERELQSFSQEELLNKIDIEIKNIINELTITKEQLQRYENGEVIPSEEKISFIAKVLGIPSSKIFYKEDK